LSAPSPTKCAPPHRAAPTGPPPVRWDRPAPPPVPPSERTQTASGDIPNRRVRLGPTQQPAPHPTEAHPPETPPVEAPRTTEPPRRARRGHRYLPDPDSGEPDPGGGPYFRVPMPENQVGQARPVAPEPPTVPFQLNQAAPAARAPKPPATRPRPDSQPPGERRSAAPKPPPVRPAPPSPAPSASTPAAPAAQATAPAPTAAPQPQPPAPAGPKPIPQRGWRRGLYRLTRINPGLSRDEKYELSLRTRIRRQPRGSYQIGMLGLKGGVGKTTTTVTLGTMLAQVRGDRILGLDADPGCGNLAERAGRTSPSSIADLVADKNVSHYNDVRAHISVNSDNLEILPTAEYATAARGLSGEDLRLAVDTVSKFYNLVLADCGPGLFDPVTRGVLETASAIVIVTNVSVDSARQAESALKWLRHNGYQDLLDRVVVVVNHVAVGETNVAEKQLVRQFQQLVRPDRVVLLPWDKHIATGSEIQLDQLDPDYKRRVLELAAALSDDFERAGRR
ncbi:nucleotide-binding protein, partial [Mycobacterium kiyosense]|uniref:nucleotide-binding protein n=1 Tax=Mycobacterium kiyosense TaxID=2871094 RepID=UPI0022309002